VSHTVIDHLVVAAASLAQGVAWCENTLGVTPGPGGEHPLMGTHNRLVNISTSTYAQAYLEIIAINTEAPQPSRPRWFGLDNPALQASLFGAPRLLHMVARSTMLDMHRWGLITVGQKPGDPVTASRDTAAGTLRWQILVREDGGLDNGGALPGLIQWQGPHPTDAMPASGISLHSLTLAGVPTRARDVLRLRAVQYGDASAPPALMAVLTTRFGDITLSSST
jgi:hypothetical protein